MALTYRFEIDYPELNNKTISQSPVISWGLYDADHATITQLGKKIRLVRHGTPQTTIVPLYEPALTSADARLQSYQCTRLRPGDYTLYLSVLLNPSAEIGFSTETSYFFTVAKYQENIIRWEKNDTEDAYSFLSWFSTSDINITSNPERIKLALDTEGFPVNDTVSIIFDSQAAGAQWHKLNTVAIKPEGTLVDTFARSAATRDALTYAGYVAITDGILGGLSTPDKVAKNRFLEIKYVLWSGNNNSVTPLIDSTIISYKTFAALTPTAEFQYAKLDGEFPTPFSLNNTTELVSGVVRLKANGYLYYYNSPGFINLIITGESPAVFDSVTLDQDIPASSSLSMSWRTFDKFKKREENTYKTITPVGNIYTLNYDSGDDKKNTHRYLDLRIDVTGFNPNGPYTVTPAISLIEVASRVILNPNFAYAFTTKFSLPDYLKNIFIEANDNLDEIDLCEILYGINVQNPDSLVWEDYQVIEKQKIISAITNNGTELRLGMKLTSDSLAYYPEVDEVGMIIETNDGSKVYYNK